MKNLLKNILIGFSLTFLSSTQTMQLSEIGKSSFNFLRRKPLLSGLALCGMALYYMNYRKAALPKDDTEPSTLRFPHLEIRPEIIEDPLEKKTVTPQQELGLTDMHDLAFLSQDQLDKKLLTEIVKGDRLKVQALLLQGASANAMTEYGSNALIKSVLLKTAESDEITRMLLEHGADLNKKNRFGMNALMIACKENYTEKALILLNAYKKEEIDAVNNQGETALMLASYHGNGELINHLILLGAEIDKQNHHGETALIYCLENTRSALNGLIRLLKNRANTDICDRYNNTALSLAVQNHTPTVTKQILDYQRPVHLRKIPALLKNSEGFTVLEEAFLKEQKQKGHLFMIQIFLHEAD